MTAKTINLWQCRLQIERKKYLIFNLSQTSKTCEAGWTSKTGWTGQTTKTGQTEQTTKTTKKPNTTSGQLRQLRQVNQVR